MGDRANVIIKDGKSTVYLYTHWAGSDLPETVERALSRARKAKSTDDGPYLARVIFCEMIREDGIDGTRGYGISAEYGDGGGAPDITIDVDKQTIQVGNKAPRDITA